MSSHLFSLPLSSKASSAILLNALAARFHLATLVPSIADNHTSTSSMTISRLNSPSRTVPSNEYMSLSLSSTLIFAITSTSILLTILNAKGFFAGRDASSSEDPPVPPNDRHLPNPLSERARIDNDGQPPPPPSAAISSDARKRRFSWLLWLISFILYILVSAAVLYCYRENIVKFVKVRLIKYAVQRWLGPWGQYSIVRWIVDKCLSLDLELRHVPLWIYIPVVVFGTYLILLPSYLHTRADVVHGSHEQGTSQ
ncbi:hypothetical protein C8R44DRAFT_870022 [Mycena epipterygia]|nr:hypothetical protein C8R44DRAFT_870022 [Mycena epipterygia]